MTIVAIYSGYHYYYLSEKESPEALKFVDEALSNEFANWMSKMFYVLEFDRKVALVDKEDFLKNGGTEEEYKMMPKFKVMICETENFENAIDNNNARNV